MRIDKLPDGTIYRVIAGSFAAWRHDEVMTNVNKYGTDHCRACRVDLYGVL